MFSENSVNTSLSVPPLQILAVSKSTKYLIFIFLSIFQTSENQIQNAENTIQTSESHFQTNYGF